MADPKTILIVEDEALIAMAVADDVADMGRPSSVTTAEAALAVLAGQDVHFAIVDFHLGHGTSRDVIAALQGRGIPFVICTGSLPEVEDGALDGLPQLSKPYLSSDLRKLVAAAF